MIPKLTEFKNRWQFESDYTIRPGLEAVENALRQLGNPENNLHFIHVSGTNGKGSTITFMEALLRAHGYTTATFTSPAVTSLYDQICYNNHHSTIEQIDAAFERLKEKGLSGTLTDFELLTVIAILVFEELSPDYVLFETGMGGLLDSTNVITPIVSVITSIALDHTGFLGETIEEIATHKAGIIKEHVPAVIGLMDNHALGVIKAVAKRKEASLCIYGEDFKIEDKQFTGSNTLRIGEQKMKGKHQRVNASVAIEALFQAGIHLQEEYVQEALASAQLANRFEEIYPNVFLDGAHNPAAANALKQTIEEEFPGEKVDFIIGMLARKDINGTLDALMPVAESFTFIDFDHPEAADSSTLMKACQHDRKEVTKIEDGSIILINDRNRRKVITGSLYLLASLSIRRQS